MVENKFINEYDPTIEDMYRCILYIDDKMELLEIFDTAGMEDFMDISYYDRRYRDGQLFVLVYSISNSASFHHIKEEYEQICRHHEERQFDVVLVGNKCDLSDSIRDVSIQMGQDLANEWNIPFIETSAKTGENVSKIFELLIKDQYKRESNKELENDNTNSSGCISCKVL